MLKLKIPPVGVFLIAIVLMCLLDLAAPNDWLNFPFRKLIAWLLFIFGGSVGILGVLEFQRVSTTVNPHKPENAKFVVHSGVYRLSRNPMYLALLVVLASWSFYLGNIFTVIFLPLFILYMNEFQIKPEEQTLDKKFGQDFESYKNKVRRWI